jgi:glucan biosynthesis protein
MGLFSRLSRRHPASSTAPEPTSRQAQQITLAHFHEFVRTRRGVEAYIEPETNDTSTTLMLIAGTGEWTRRRVPNPDAAREVATALGIPVYDVHRTGYPQRMREWNTQQRAKE